MMAIRPCRECHREISTDAVACPHCGVRLVSDVSSAGKRIAAAALAVVGLTASCVGCLQTSTAGEPAWLPFGVGVAALGYAAYLEVQTKRGK